MSIKVKLIDIEMLTEQLLEDVDYDIYKEDLEDRCILDGMSERIADFLEKLGVEVDEEG